MDHYGPNHDGDFDIYLERFNSVMAKLNDFQNNLERDCTFEDCGLIEMISRACAYTNDDEYISYSCSDYCENAADDINKDLHWIFKITAGIGNLKKKKVRKK